MPSTRTAYLHPLALATLLALGLCRCVTGPHQGPSFATGFDVPESDGILIEWRQCLDTAPCLAGEFEGRPYALGFHESPSVIVGLVGGTPVHFALDPASVYRLGDHAIDLEFFDEPRHTMLTLTWNELNQRPIEAQLISTAGN